MVILRPLVSAPLLLEQPFYCYVTYSRYSQSTRQTAEVLVADPFKYTFTRPLGKLIRDCSVLFPEDNSLAASCASLCRLFPLDVQGYYCISSRVLESPVNSSTLSLFSISHRARLRQVPLSEQLKHILKQAPIA